MQGALASTKRIPRNLALIFMALVVIVGGVIGAAVTAEAATAKRRITKSTFYYETYIPASFLDAPEGLPGTCQGGADWWYGGDNRQAGFNTKKYRTQVKVAFDFKRKKWSYNTSIHPTMRYKKVNGKLVFDSAKTAGDEGIKIERMPRISKKSGEILLTHTVGNPFCAGITAIDYTFSLKAYQSGKTSIAGSHDRMPNHEMWRQDFYSDGTKTQKMVFSHPLRDPKCLVDPVCPQKEYSYKS